MVERSFDRSVLKVSKNQRLYFSTFQHPQNSPKSLSRVIHNWAKLDRDNCRLILDWAREGGG